MIRIKLIYLLFILPFSMNGQILNSKGETVVKKLTVTYPEFPDDNYTIEFIYNQGVNTVKQVDHKYNTGKDTYRFFHDEGLLTNVRFLTTAPYGNKIYKLENGWLKNYKQELNQTNETVNMDFVYNHRGNLVSFEYLSNKIDRKLYMHHRKANLIWKDNNLIEYRIILDLEGKTDYPLSQSGQYKYYTYLNNCNVNFNYLLLDGHFPFIMEGVIGIMGTKMPNCLQYNKGRYSMELSYYDYEYDEKDNLIQIIQYIDGYSIYPKKKYMIIDVQYIY